MNQINNILFVGGFFTKENESHIIKDSKKNIQNAANVLQWNIIDGLINNHVDNISLLTAPFIGTYPINYRKKILEKDESFYLNIKIDQIHFINILGIKNYSIYYELKKKICKWIMNNDTKTKVIIFYSIQDYYLELANWIKSNWPDVILHIVIPDLPHYMYIDKQKNILYKLKVRKLIKKCEKYINIFDSYTVLTSQIAESLRLNKGSYVVIEGMIGNDIYESSEYYSIDNYGDYCLYTGTLTAAYGIVDLIQAFNQINNNDLKLIICGEGETKEKIIEYSKQNSNIIYLGQVDRDIVRKLQNSSLFLINPRKNNDTFTKYSFPSKTMEYLQSGRPVLCYKLDGIPEEYNDYLIYFDENSMVKTIEKYSLMSKQKLDKIGKKGKMFVEKNKTNVEQVKRILILINQKVN